MAKRTDYYRQIIDRDNWVEGTTDEYPYIKRILRRLVRDAAVRVNAEYDFTNSAVTKQFADRIARELIP